MIFTQVDAFSDLAQGWLAIGVLFEIINDLLDTSIIIGELFVVDHAIIICKQID